MWLFLIVIGLMSQNWCTALQNKLPCKYQDSIDPNKNKGNIRNYTENCAANIAENGSFGVRVCPCCMRPCIRLFCWFGEYTITGQCLNNKIKILQKQFLWNVSIDDCESQTVDLNKHFSLLYNGTGNGKINYHVGYKLKSNGDITDGIRTYSYREYYLGLQQKANGKMEPIFLIEDEIYQKMPSTAKSKTHAFILAICSIISIPFVIITMVVYICIPELRNLHGKCFLCYMLSLLIGYICTATTKLSKWQHDDVRYTIFGYLIYGSYMSAFLWSNITSYDLWRNFRQSGLRVGGSYDRNRFLYYILYGWGLTSLFTISIFILDKTEPFCAAWLPGVGKIGPFLKGFKPGLIYFHLPMCIIFSVNIVFFTITLYKIQKLKKEVSSIISIDESACHQRQLNDKNYNVMLFLRLFVVMGSSWIMEGISFSIQHDKDNYFFLICDMANALQGIPIFLLFVLKRRIWDLIKKRTLSDSPTIRTQSRSSSSKNTIKLAQDVNRMKA